MYARALLLVVLAALVLTAAPASADPEGDASVQMSAPNSVEQGEEILYTITVQSSGAGPATEVELEAPVPVGTVALGAVDSDSDAECDDVDESTTVFECDLETIAEGESVIVLLAVDTSAQTPSPVEMVVTITDGDTVADNDTATASTTIESSNPPPPPPPPDPPPPPPPPDPPPPPPPPQPPSPPPSPPPPSPPPPSPPPPSPPPPSPPPATPPPSSPLPSPPPASPASPVQASPPTPVVAAPDVIPPAKVGAVRAIVGSRSVLVRWRLPTDPDFDRVELMRSATGAARRVIYSGTEQEFTDRSVRNGVRYSYELRSIDLAGNASAGVRFAATPKALRLFSPPPNARVLTAPVLRWAAVRGTGFYNVQLYRGSKKVLSIWPRSNRLKLANRWLFLGRVERLVPGTYHWFVWPGRGALSRPDYGPLLGRNSFVVARKRAPSKP